jgi:hypothetical protein
MNRNDLECLQCGDIVEITQAGLNRGKKAKVAYIKNNEYGMKVYLEPINCEFEFSNEYYAKRRKHAVHGWMSFNTDSFKLIKN